MVSFVFSIFYKINFGIFLRILMFGINLGIIEGPSYVTIFSVTLKSQNISLYQ